MDGSDSMPNGEAARDYHPHNAESQSNGDADGQSLGDGGHSKGHADGKHVQELLSLEPADARDDCDDDETEETQLLAQVIHGHLHTWQAG